MTTDDSADYLQRLAERFPIRIKHAGALGIVISECRLDRVVATMPLSADYLGDIEYGLVHTGVITTLIDSISGIAAMARIGKPSDVATLDLRVDYLRATRLDTGPTLSCSASCYRLTEQIAFVRAEVWQADATQPVASSLSTFMIRPREGESMAITR
jgi:uncharacterized protein (TIGR00369 family)